MDDSIFPRIASITKSKDAWDILETVYQGLSKVKVTKLQTLREKFENMQMNDTHNVDQFHNHLITYVNQMRTHGEKISDQKVVEKALRSLPSQFDVVVVAIEESKDLTQLSIDKLMGSLLSHESRMSRNSNFSLDNSFKT